MKIVDVPEVHKYWVLEKAFITDEGYYGEVILQETGFRCGYVGLDKDHGLHGKSYLELIDIDVHGGLTWSGEEDDLWKLGFDCAHLSDGRDMEALKEYGFELTDAVHDGHIWTLEEVIEEVKKLSMQLTPESYMQRKIEEE